MYLRESIYRYWQTSLNPEELTWRRISSTWVVKNTSCYKKIIILRRTRKVNIFERTFIKKKSGKTFCSYSSLLRIASWWTLNLLGKMSYSVNCVPEVHQLYLIFSPSALLHSFSSIHFLLSPPDFYIRNCFQCTHRWRNMIKRELFSPQLLSILWLPLRFYYIHYLELLFTYSCHASCY